MARTKTGAHVPGTSHNPATSKIASGVNRTPAQRAHDLQETARMYLEGKSQWEIAGFLGVSVMCVHRDLKKLSHRWTAKADIDFDAKKAEELAKLDRVERTAWEAWDKSCKQKEIKGSKARDGGIKGSFDEAWERQEERDGDPRFLEIVYKCILKRMETLGLDAPKKLVVSGPGGGPIEHEHTHETEQDREIARLLAGLDRRGEASVGAAVSLLPEGFEEAS